MKSAVLLVFAGVLFAACIWFFSETADLFAQKDYLAGLLHVLVGFALVRAAVELSRLAVLGRQRGVP